MLVVASVARAQVPRALELMARGEYQEATRILQPLQQDPLALYGLARIALVENRHQDAAALLQRAIEREPSNAVFHYWLGVAYGQMAEASMNPLKQTMLALRVRKELERAVKLDPNLIEARFGLIEYYLEAPSFLGGDEGLAFRQAHELLLLNRLQGHRAYATIDIHKKKLDAARNELTEAVREEPRSAAAHAFLGSFLGQHAKDAAAGFEELETAVTVDPGYMPAFYDIGELAASSRTNLARGEAALEKYLTHVPSDDEQPLADAHYLLGRIYEEEGKRSAARDSYATAARMDPTSRAFAAAAKHVR